MNFVNREESERCDDSASRIFELPPTQISVESRTHFKVTPNDGFAKGTLCFEIKSDSDHYLSLSETKLSLKLAIYNGESKLKKEEISEKISVVNNLIHSIFSQQQVSINNVEVENSNANHNYRAYLEDLLSYDGESKEALLHSNIFAKDEACYLDSIEFKNKVTPASVANDFKFTPELVEKKINQGLIDRQLFFILNDNSVQTTTYLHSDIFTINKYLLPKCDIKLQLTRSRDAFYLLAATEEKYHIRIEEAYLRVCRVKLNQSLMLEHIMQLEKTTAKYPIKKVEVVSHVMALGAIKARINNVVTGVLPNRIVIGFVDTLAYNGAINKNPYNFKHYNMSSLKLKNGSECIPYAEGIQMEFDQNNYLEAYNTLFEGLGETPKDIDYIDYRSGYTLYCFDLTPDRCNGEHFNLYKDGGLALEYEFKTAPELTSVTAIVYSEFDRLLEINSNRKAFVS